MCSYTYYSSSNKVIISCFVFVLLSKVAESEYEKVVHTSDNTAYGVSHVRGAGPQSGSQEYELPSLDLQPQSSAVEEPVYEGMP